MSTFANPFLPPPAVPTRDARYTGAIMRCAACNLQIGPLEHHAEDVTPFATALAAKGAVTVTIEAGARRTVCGERCATVLRAGEAKAAAPVGRDESAFVWSAPSTVAGQSHLTRVTGTCHGCLGSSFDTMLARSEPDALSRHLLGISWLRVNRGDGRISWACSADCRAMALNAASPYQVTGTEAVRRLLDSGAKTSEQIQAAKREATSPDVTLTCTYCRMCHSLPAHAAALGFPALGWQGDPSGTGNVCSTLCRDWRRYALGLPIGPGVAPPPPPPADVDPVAEINDASYQRRRQETAATASAAARTGLQARGLDAAQDRGAPRRGGR